MEQAQVTIQITPTSLPSEPSWMGEVTAVAQVLTHTGILKTIQEQVRFARIRCGHYDLIDFVAVLIGYVVSGELTLLAFYQRLLPWASPFMALGLSDESNRMCYPRLASDWKVGSQLVGRGELTEEA